jgi:hypothetical protein
MLRGVYTERSECAQHYSVRLSGSGQKGNAVEGKSRNLAALTNHCKNVSRKTSPSVNAKSEPPLVFLSKQVMIELKKWLVSSLLEGWHAKSAR